MKKSKIFFIISMVVFGTISIFVRNISLSSSEISLYRSVFAFIVILAFLLLTKKLVPLNKIKKDIVYLICSGIAMGFNWVLLFEAYKYTSVSIATLAYYFAPVIVAIACTFLFKERMSTKNIICFLFSTLGIVFVSGIVGTKADMNQIKGFLFGLGAAILYATVILLNKKMKEVEGINRTCYQFVFAIMVLLPYVLISEGFSLMTLDSISWINLLILGVFHTGITYCLYFISLKDLSGQEVGILSYIDPMIAILISICVLHESMDIYRIIGACLILVFSIINEINFKNLNILKANKNS